MWGQNTGYSASLLLEKLAAAGFRDFDAFMAAAVLQETRSRNFLLGRDIPAHLEALERLLETTADLLAASEIVTAATWEYRYVPMNLRIQAGEIGDAGISMNIISRNYGILMQSIEDMLALFRDAVVAMTNAIGLGAFLDCGARIQAEMADVFSREQASGEGPLGEEIERLEALRDAQLHGATEKLVDIQRCAQRFFAVAGEMQRLTSGLGAIKVMGKVESAQTSAGKFTALIADLEAYQAAMSRGLAAIGRINNVVRSHIRKIEVSATS